MRFLEFLEPFAYAFAGIAAIIGVVYLIYVAWAWLLFPFKVLHRMDRLIDLQSQTNTQLAALNQRLGSAEIVTEQVDA
jgi:hypothetical protein